MGNKIPTKEEALTLLYEYNKTDSLRNHGIAVEAVMRHFARKYGEDEEMWGIIGLIHDLDYEMYPDKHCEMTKRILEENDWKDDWIRAIMSHAYGFTTDIEPISQLEKTLYAIDELTGLVIAVAYVRPSRSLADLEVKSVKKKWKEKSFAAGANRDVILEGAGKLGIELDELISETILGLRTVSNELGL
jgi:predicted hydrolase (HD superfamily)